MAELADAIRVGLAPGSTPAQVVAFLDGRNVGHSEYIEKTRSLHASTREEQVNPLSRTRVLIVFHFDEAARMTSFSVEQGVTGL